MLFAVVANQKVQSVWRDIPAERRLHAFLCDGRHACCARGKIALHDSVLIGTATAELLM